MKLNLKGLLIISVFLLATFGTLSGLSAQSTDNEIKKTLDPNLLALINYIQSHGETVSTGEATKVLAMLQDQLCEHEGTLFLLYMMAPDNKTVEDPSITYKELFENVYPYKSMKETFDYDIHRFTKMSMKEKTAYLKHKDNGFQQAIERISNYDVNKMSYVLTKVNMSDFTAQVNSTANSVRNSDITAARHAANNIKDMMDTKAGELDKADIEYDILLADNSLPTIDLNNLTDHTENLNASLHTLNKTMKQVGDAMFSCGVITAALGGTLFPVGIILVLIGAPQVLAISILLLAGTIAFWVSYNQVVNVSNEIKRLIETLG